MIKADESRIAVRDMGLWKPRKSPDRAWYVGHTFNVTKENWAFALLPGLSVFHLGGSVQLYADHWQRKQLAIDWPVLRDMHS